MADKKNQDAKKPQDPAKVDPSEYKNIPGNQTGQGRGDPRAERHAREARERESR